MRWRRFVVFQPLILLSTAALNYRLCQQSCASYPAESAVFGQAAGLLRLIPVTPIWMQLQPVSPDESACAALAMET